MGVTEILIIIFVSLISAIIIGTYIYKKIKGVPTSTCSCGKKKITGKTLVEEYHKKYGNKCCGYKEEN